MRPWYWLLWLFWLTIHSKVSSAAGVSVHLAYLARSFPNVESIKNYSPWYKTGAFFPDALYTCDPSNKAWHDFAEASHWPPFLTKAVKLWHAKYGKNETTRYCSASLKLRSFLTGIYTHQIVDTSWHSLVPGYRSHGLLRVLSETEFDGNDQDAHNYLDVMGDFIMLGNFMRLKHDPGTWFTNQNWSLPEQDDIMELLHINGLDQDKIDYQELDACIRRGLVASVSEAHTILNHRDKMRQIAYRISPRSMEFLQNHWIGGEYNLVVLLQKCVPEFTSIFDSHSEEVLQKSLDRLKFCSNLPQIGSGSQRGLINFQVTDQILGFYSRNAFSNFGASLELGHFGSQGRECLAVSAPIETGDGKIYLIPWNTIEAHQRNELQIANVQQPFPFISGKTARKFIWDKSEYLVVSQPATNSLHIYHSMKLMLTIFDPDVDTNELELLTCKNNKDFNRSEIYLGTKYYGYNETGIVYLIQGKDIGPLLNNAKLNKINIRNIATVIAPSTFLQPPFGHFGSSAEAVHYSDKKGFAFITSQSTGIVYAYKLPLAKKQEPTLEIFGDNIDTFNPARKILLKPSRSHGMFGQVLYSWTYKSYHFLAASQTSLNQVFIYNCSESTVTLFTKIKLPTTFEPVPSSINFGASISYSHAEQLFYISSTGSFNGQGAIWKLHIDDLIQAGLESRILTLHFLRNLFTVGADSSENGVTNFGAALLDGPKGELIIGAPQQSYADITSRQLCGKVYIM